MTDKEILESLPSLYPLKDFEEEAVLNVCKILDDIKAIDGLKTRNRSRWFQTDKDTLTHYCSNGFYKL